MLLYVFVLLFGLVVGGSLLTLFVGLRTQTEIRTIGPERLYTAGAAMTVDDLELGRPFHERVLRPIASSVLRFLARMTPQGNLEILQHKLEVAGRPYGWIALDFLGLRVLCAVLFGGLVLLLTFLGGLPLARKLILVLACSGLGFYLPVVWLDMRVRQRKAAILRALPDGLDMLNVCVGAGLGFDASLSRVGDMWQTPLADEFSRVVLEVRLGKTRQHALTDLARRTEVTEVENFVATILQADQLGVSIAKVLRTQSDQMRILRRQRAEEMARQATIKLLFPLVFLIFPAMLAVLLGPAVPQLVRTLGSLGG